MQPKEKPYDKQPKATKPKLGKEEGLVQPEIEIQKGDYAEARKTFQTHLTKKMKAPGKLEMLQMPPGVKEVEFNSGTLKLRAWLSVPEGIGQDKNEAVLFLHGGFAFGAEDWEMAKPYRDAGFVVMAPRLRGENGQEGAFSLFYDEVDDVIAALDYLAAQPFVDAKQIHVAGHSVGGTLALLAAMTSSRFKSAASFSASPDQAIYCKVGIPQKIVPFSMNERRELQMRSPLAYAASFKCPVRMFYGMQEPHFHLSTQQTRKLARAKKLDVDAIRIEGNHESAVPDAMKRSIKFFRRS